MSPFPLLVFVSIAQGVACANLAQAPTYGTNYRYNEQDRLPVHREPIDTTIVSVPSEHLTPIGPNHYMNDAGETFVFPGLDSNPPVEARASTDRRQRRIVRRATPRRRRHAKGFR